MEEVAPRLYSGALGDGEHRPTDVVPGKRHDEFLPIWSGMVGIQQEFHEIGPTAPEPLLVTPDDEGEAVFSPDGERIAFARSQNGKFQVFVRGFPATGPDVQVSLTGGSKPQWSADGRDVYFRNDDKVMAAAIPMDGTLPETPRLLIPRSYLTIGSTYARGVQNGRFLMIRPIKKAPTHLDVVLYWTEDVKRKVDAAKP